MISLEDINRHWYYYMSIPNAVLLPTTPLIVSPLPQSQTRYQFEARADSVVPLAVFHVLQGLAVNDTLPLSNFRVIGVQVLDLLQ